jgi:hypothetical protein
MANKKINQLVAKTTIQSTDLFPIGDATTGTLFKKTIADLQAAIGGAVISVNGLVGTVVLDTDDILELPSPTNKYFTEARARAAISLTTSGSSGASTYSSSTGVLNVPTYTLAGLGGITASFLSGGTGITYNSTTGVIAYSGTVYTDSSVRNLFSGSTGISYNSSTGAFSSTITQYTDALARAAISGTAPITYNSTTGAIGITQATTSTDGYLSSTDWNTFNSKQSTLTNPITGTGTTNTVPKFTSASALGNSNITDTGSLITLGSNTNVSSGALGIGTSSLSNISLNIAKNITGATSIFSVIQQGAVQSDVTSIVYSIGSTLNTQATTFTLNNFLHFRAAQGTIGAGSTVTNQYGFLVHSSLTGATNNYGFFSDLTAGTNRWNIFMSGNANNYLAGRLALGSTAGISSSNLSNRLSITGGTTSNGTDVEATVSSDVTSEARGFSSVIGTSASSFTLANLVHYRASQATIGAGSSITTQTAFFANSNIIGATTNYGFRGSIPSGTNRWNIYMDGTANNYMAGSLGIGVSPTAFLHVKGGNNNSMIVDNDGSQYTPIYISNNGSVRAFNVWDNTNLAFQVGTAVASSSLQLVTNNIERMRITAGGSVGIGVTSPNGMLHVNGRIYGVTTSSYADFNSGGLITYGAGSTTKYTQIGYDTTGSYGWIQALITGVAYSNLTINAAGGNLLLGTLTDNGEKLYVSGNIRATGTITANSDINLKKNLLKIENALEKVEQINGYTYEFKSDDSKRHAGVIAQEIEGVLPEIVNKGNDGLLGVEYGNISALLIEAIKDLKSQNESLVARLEALEK